MSRVIVTSERTVEASPEAVYEVLSDYKSKRPLMLTENFLDYRVEQGGRGTGTVVSYRLRAANRERPYKIRVDEALEGQVLTERDSNSSLVTTWTLSPQDSGSQTNVRIVTEWEGGSGVRGFFERTFAPLGLRRIYRNMLDLLAFIVQPVSKPGSGAVESRSEGAGSRAGIILLTVGAVSASALAAWYLRHQTKKNDNVDIELESDRGTFQVEKINR